jgi:hypothetical protein
MTSLELDLSPFLDQLVERIVDEVTERLAERLFGPLPAPAPAPDPTASVVDVVAPEAEAPQPASPAAPEPVPRPTRKQRAESEQRTCEICGRVGTRRYVQTATGWRCSPTASACSGHPKPQDEPIPAPHLEHGKYTTYDNHGCRCTDCKRAHAVYTREARADGRELAEQVAAAPRSATPLAPGVTARCQDCTRTWSLTGRVLDMATETHELKHAHIVDMLVDQTA